MTISSCISFLLIVKDQPTGEAQLEGIKTEYVKT
jgi:hypothetical protein